MKLTLGLFLTLVGACIMLAGIFLALRSLVGLYQGVLDDPMGDARPVGGPEPGDAAQQGMYQGVIFGAVGIPPFLIGIIIVKGAIARKLLRAGRRAG
jgi:hypothetical protein